ncbi:MAG: hypothetical protein CAPSK01_002973 [Candidatus Accumulibacter vicinus]|uniref:Uncharacterized protein n=1 Tax=Candidatus Accumulibacter vicinus TaxID=2954382 RepID=A0A084XYI8_9PROT|nr:MAG: hypothetical protein CAPSK01_002973 [Candidatus Accumulibacter vicinus]
MGETFGKRLHTSALLVDLRLQVADGFPRTGQFFLRRSERGLLTRRTLPLDLPLQFAEARLQGLCAGIDAHESGGVGAFHVAYLLTQSRRSLLHVGQRRIILGPAAAAVAGSNGLPQSAQMSFG